MNFNIKNNFKENQFTLVILSVTFILAIIIWRSGDKDTTPQKYNHIDIQTKIPKGYNLYALEIANIETINSLVGDYALVNIFQVNERKKAKLILQKIKLIRSLKNPNYFAILATNEDLEVITSYSGPFKVSLQNPNAPNQTIKNKKIRYKRTIITEDKQ